MQTKLSTPIVHFELLADICYALNTYCQPILLTRPVLKINFSDIDFENRLWLEQEYKVCARGALLLWFYKDS